MSHHGKHHTTNPGGPSIPSHHTADASKIHVRGTIVKVFPNAENSQGQHQHFQVKITEDIDNPGSARVGETVFLALRYGDAMGLPTPIEGLQSNTPVEAQGKYVTNPYSTPDNSNPSLNVLHFTHHPFGFVIYKGVRYS